ncbi:hypothetical protein Q1695_000246 [Nippostrongylus brasiliensis]|nr:hypothetical protein Q1695_000246 [Nippostrongylus brasiliensis]
MEYRSAKKKTKQCMVINNLLKGVMLNIDLHILLPKRWLSDVTGKDDASCNTRSTELAWNRYTKTGRRRRIQGQKRCHKPFSATTLHPSSST